MEKITLTLSFKNLQNALDVFINDFISIYKSILIRDNKKASGNLISSIKPITISFKNNKLEGSISLASYWKYVEYGRKPGKFPPPNDILKWVKIKPVLPRPLNGIKPTEKQLAFLISRKIANNGIKPGNQFSEALDIAWKKYENDISKAISQDLAAEIDLIKL